MCLLTGGKFYAARKKILQHNAEIKCRKVNLTNFMFFLQLSSNLTITNYFQGY